MAPTLAPRPWLPDPVSARVGETLASPERFDTDGAVQWLDDLVADDTRIHDHTSLNLNPATNRMNPRAERSWPSASRRSPTPG